MKLPTMLAGDFDTHFSLDNMRKDSVYALELAQNQGLTLPSMETVSQRMTELCEQGLAQNDYTALVSPYLD
jgi:3-hydroxyisobutyrate dehydrogenase-like beta-hydroxyacid dehydrogenase